MNMLHSHTRQASVASFASSLYLPVDPENPTKLDDETDTYPSSDELFGPDHEEGDDYTISSRRYLSSHRNSTAFSYVSHPPTPPRSTHSTMSLERSSSSISLTSPHLARHSNTELSFSPSAWTNKPVLRTMTSTTSELPSPPSTAHSSHEAPMSATLDQLTAESNAEDQGVPIEKFDQLALEHLEKDQALLQMLRKLDDQKLRIAQLTYALSRLRILSNSACLSPPESGAPIATASSSVIQPRRLGAVIPKPLIVQQSPKSATYNIGRALSSGNGTAALSGPSTNEAVNQRRRAKQQLHDFALRRPARMAKGRGNNKLVAAGAAARARSAGWEGARGSPSLVMKETKPRAAQVVDHPNITIRRPQRPDPPPHIINSARTLHTSAPTHSATSSSSATPPRLLSSPSSATSKSPQTPARTQVSPPDVYDPSATRVSRQHGDIRQKPLPPRPVSPTKPMRLARNISFTYEIPPVPPLDQTTAHITLVDRSRATPPLPVDEVQHRLAATFAHFSSKSRASSPQPPSAYTFAHAPSPAPPRASSPPRRALDFPHDQPDYLQQMLHRKWVDQLDEHSHQARGSWKSPIKAIKQRLAGGFGAQRRPSRASTLDSASDTTHSQSHAHASLDVPGYVQGLGTVDEGGDSEYGHGGRPLTPAPDAKARKSKKKGGSKEEGGVLSKSSWRFSRLGSSAS